MKKFWLNSLMATSFVFALMYGLSKVTTLELFNAFDPIGQALNDVELTDHVFSNLRPDPLVDERVVLVNIGELSRGGIAEQIRILSQHRPKAIGIDSYFDCEGGLRDPINCPQLLDTLGNLLLANAIQEAGNVVLVSKLLQSDSLYRSGAVDVYDSLEYSDAIFSDHALSGYANLTTNAEYQEDVKVCRSFVPKMDVKGREEVAFAVRVAMMYDSAKARQFLERGKREELINFRGNVEVLNERSLSGRRKNLATTKYPMMFYALDVDDVLTENFEPDMIKDKIIIMGFMGEYFGDPSWNDKFFTPLNKKVAGRANPDMFGAVVHANAVSMILNGDFISELKEWHKYAIAVGICFLNIALFFYLSARFPVWFDSFQLMVQFLQIFLLMGLTIWVFAVSNFKLDLTLTILTIALAGPAFEFYDNVLTSSVRNLKNKRFTNRREEVLTLHDE